MKKVGLANFVVPAIKRSERFARIAVIINMGIRKFITQEKKMVIIMEPNATKEQIGHIVERIEQCGLRAHVVKGENQTIIGLIGDRTKANGIAFDIMPGVERTQFISAPYKLASRDFKQEDTVIDVGGVKIGGKEIIVMAGPCAVESLEQIKNIACEVKQAGAKFLRGGAFKPRTGPYSFQGLGQDGLLMLAEAKAKTGLGIITEVMTPADVELVSRYADILQIGARNMQNFFLLKEVGASGKPVMLKRGMSATIEEWLLAAEYILSSGNQNVMLCERGIRTFETYTRNTLDLSAVPVVKDLSHLPVIVDPSHGTGLRHLVPPMSKAAIAAGADGLLIEVHKDSEHAKSDGAQALLPAQFAQLMQELQIIAMVVGRVIG